MSPANFADTQVKTLTGRAMDFRVDNLLLALELKEVIQASEDIPTDYQRLLFNGRQMDDAKLLASQGVMEGSVVTLILRLRA